MDEAFYTTLIVVLVLLSGFFSASETAFTCLNKIRLKNMATNGDKKAQLAVKLSTDFDKLISTLLIGNNIVNIAAATLATMLFTKLLSSDTAGATVSTIVITIVVLIFGEIAPKTIAKQMPEELAKSVSPVINVLAIIFAPISKILGYWQKLVIKVFKPKNDATITDEEIKTLVDEAEIEGGLDEYEGELIRSALEFDDLTVADILTPRVDVEATSQNSRLDKALQIFRETGYSRIPVYSESIDNIVGIVNEKDCYKAFIDKNRNLRDIISNDIIFTAPNTKISVLLRKLQKHKSHMSIVVDEYGGTMGIVTMEDILEELVGDIWDEHDEIIENFTKIDETTYKVQGDAELEEFFEYFDANKANIEYEPVTLSGFVIHLLGALANVGDVVSYENLELTVDKVENHTVSELTVKVIISLKNEEQDD
ncbi:MAG: hemolysin family protein [Bacillota bacterium]